jgi:hypothetical protein
MASLCIIDLWINWIKTWYYNGNKGCDKTGFMWHMDSDHI